MSLFYSTKKERKHTKKALFHKDSLYIQLVKPTIFLIKRLFFNFEDQQEFELQT